jgi:hypothetical protein
MPGDGELGRRSPLEESWLPAAGAFAAALACALALAGVTHPDVIFPKYLAAAAPPAQRAERLLDYSPLYLTLVEALLPFGYAFILGVQAVLHAATAAAVALSASLLAGRRWAWVGGMGVAAYRPFLVYCGMLEPETVILACLALAVLLGLLARARLGSAATAAVLMPPEDAAAMPEPPGVAAPEPVPPAAAAPKHVGEPQASPPVAPPSGRRLATPTVVALAFACLAAAALGRPQHLLLIPVWAVWMTAAAPPGPRRRSARRLAWGAALVVGAAVLGPPLVERARLTGVPVIMNPGAVFYEGNGPGATGLTRFAPPAVIQLERAHRESVDYGHVAYRRIAAAATGRQLGPLAANRYWTGLAWEAMAARPAAAARRFGRKALLALAPYEGHDLLIAERLDRRLRRWLPWGFAVPLLALSWLPLARRSRLAELAGPLAMAALACAVQAAVYASARQRLPAALALWIVLPALAADLARGRLSGAVRPSLALLLGVAVALGLAAATARTAVLDQAGWDRLLGRPGQPGQPRRPAAGADGDELCAFLDGRALRPRLRQAAERFAAGVAFARRRRPAESLRLLAPLLGSSDYTSDDREVGVPEYWAALDLLAMGDRSQAAAMAAAAWRLRAEDERVAALAWRLGRPRDLAPPAELVPGPTWRLPGCDPVSARMALAAAAFADGDRAAASALLRPLAAAFPELAGAGSAPAAPAAAIRSPEAMPGSASYPRNFTSSAVNSSACVQPIACGPSFTTTRWAPLISLAVRAPEAAIGTIRSALP